MVVDILWCFDDAVNQLLSNVKKYILFSLTDNDNGIHW